MTKVTLEARLAARERPNETPIMHQDWRDLLFLHWKYDPAEIQKTLPPGLFVDTFNNEGYITISPFSLENLRLMNLPSIPGFSNFVEVNTRTYVYDRNGTPGIWFYSLDINSFIAAQAARKVFSLPYFFSELQKQEKRNEISIYGERKSEPIASMKFTYEPFEDNYLASNESLEFFLLERYFLFSFEANQLSKQQVNHKPYPISNVSIEESNHSLFEMQGLILNNRVADHVHYSSGVDVDIFSLKKVNFREYG